MLGESKFHFKPIAGNGEKNVPPEGERAVSFFNHLTNCAINAKRDGVAMGLFFKGYQLRTQEGLRIISLCQTLKDGVPEYLQGTLSQEEAQRNYIWIRDYLYKDVVKKPSSREYSPIIGMDNIESTEPYGNRIIGVTPQQEILMATYDDDFETYGKKETEVSLSDQAFIRGLHTSSILATQMFDEFGSIVQLNKLLMQQTGSPPNLDGIHFTDADGYLLYIGGLSKYEDQLQGRSKQWHIADIREDYGIFQEVLKHLPEEQN